MLTYSFLSLSLSVYFYTHVFCVKDFYFYVVCEKKVYLSSRKSILLNAPLKRRGEKFIYSAQPVCSNAVITTKTTTFFFLFSNMPKNKKKLTITTTTKRREKFKKRERNCCREVKGHCRNLFIMFRYIGNFAVDCSFYFINVGKCA